MNLNWHNAWLFLAICSAGISFLGVLGPSEPKESANLCGWMILIGFIFFVIFGTAWSLTT